MRWQSVAGWSVAVIAASGAALSVVYTAIVVRGVLRPGEEDGPAAGEILFSGR